MKARINTYAFRQASIASARLGVLGTIAHLIADDGVYEGTVLQDAIQVTTFRLTVTREVENPQVDVDLAAIVPRRLRQRERFRESAFSVAPNGYLVLYVSEGSGGFSVQLDRLGQNERCEVFDSRTLQAGDMFIVSLLRPGFYEVTSEYVQGRGEITVTYPQVGREPYVPAPPERVRVTEQGFQPSELSVGPAQGAVFAIEAPRASITVDLKRPDDGPREEGRARDTIRWTNPSPLRR